VFKLGSLQLYKNLLFKACIDNTGVILGEAKHSQQNTHLMFGGIIPPVAQAFHRKHIKAIVNETLKKSNLSMDAIDAIAVTNRPGNVCKALPNVVSKIDFL